MIYRHMLINLGLDRKEAEKVMLTLYKSTVSGINRFIEETPQHTKVLTYEEAPAVAYLKTKTHLKHVDRFFELYEFMKE